MANCNHPADKLQRTSAPGSAYCPGCQQNIRCPHPLQHLDQEASDPRRRRCLLCGEGNLVPCFIFRSA